MIQVDVQPLRGQSVIITFLGQTVLYSYNVPVAAYFLDKNLILTIANVTSRTTWQHIHDWVNTVKLQQIKKDKESPRQQRVYNIKEHIWKYDAADLLI